MASQLHRTVGSPGWETDGGTFTSEGCEQTFQVPVFHGCPLAVSLFLTAFLRQCKFILICLSF